MSVVTDELVRKFVENLQLNEEPFKNEIIRAWQFSDVKCVEAFVPRCRKEADCQVFFIDRYYVFQFSNLHVRSFYTLEERSLPIFEEESFTQFVNDKFDEFMIKEVGASYLEEKLKAITAQYKEDRETLMKPVIAREAKYKEDYVKYSKMLSSINEK